MELKTTCSSWGNGSAPFSESSTSFKREEIFPTSSYQLEFKIGNVPWIWVVFLKKKKLKFYFQIANVAKVYDPPDPNLAKFGYKTGR